MEDENKKLNDVNNRLLDENRKLFMHLPIMQEESNKDKDDNIESETTVDDLWDSNGMFILDKGYNEKE